MTETAVAKSQEDRVLPGIVYALYIFGAASVLLTLFIGLIIAYANRGTAGPRMRSHYEFLIQTFWKTIWWFLIGAVLFVVGLVLSFVLVGLPILFVGIAILCLVSVWFYVRCIVGIVYLVQDEPYPRPDAWLL